jgi:beta-lactamase regulating signal transducer with metallopeptidase domain
MSWLLIIGLKNAILVAPIALLALGIGRYSKRPALAHVLWLIVLVKLLTPPLVEVPVGWRIDVESLFEHSEPLEPIQPIAPSATAIAQASSAPTIASGPARAPSPSMDRTGFVPQAGSSAAKSSSALAPLPAPPSPALMARLFALWPQSAAFWAALTGAIWALGSAVVVALLVLRSWRFQRFVRLAARGDDQLARRVKSLAGAVGLRSYPRVVVVEGVVSPMLWGVGGSTRLIFPARLAERLGDSEIDSLLLHELAHFARGDHWVRMLELTAHVFYWWHPVVWWARREIEAAEEQCCDAWVVKHQHGSRRSYAEALLTTIDFLCEPQSALPPAACGLGDVPLLRVRLTQIMKGDLATGLSRGVKVTVLIAGVAVSPLQPALWATSSSHQLMGDPHLAAQVMPPASPSSTPLRAASAAESTTASSASAQMEAHPVASTAPIEPDAIADVPPPIRSPLWWSALSPDGRFRLEARKNGVTLVRELTTWRLDLSSYQIRCAAFAPDGRSFITGHADGTLRWWDCETGGHLNTYGDKNVPITSVAFGADNRVAAGSSSGSVMVWDLVSGEETRLSGLPYVAAVRWSPDGSRLAVGLGEYQEVEGAVLVWDPRSQIEPEQHVLPQPVGALSWLTESSLLLANWSGQTQVFQTLTGETTPALKLDKTLVSAAAWSPDCPLLSHWQAADFARGAVE